MTIERQYLKLLKESIKPNINDVMVRIEQDPRVKTVSRTKTKDIRLNIYPDINNLPDIQSIQDLEATIKQLLEDAGYSHAKFEIVLPNNFDESAQSTVFKVGDEVKVIAKDYKATGSRGKITLIDTDKNLYWVEFYNDFLGSQPFEANQLELVSDIDESIESDFNTEVAKRKFNELCKRIGSNLTATVNWLKEDPRNFDAWIKALTFLRTAMTANKDSAFIDAVNNAEYALDKDRG